MMINLVTRIIEYAFPQTVYDDNATYSDNLQAAADQYRY